MTKPTSVLERSAETRPEPPLLQKKTINLELPPVKNLSWLEKVLCRGLGIHQGKWTYMAEAECGQITVCQRCGKTRIRTKHERKWVYVTDPQKRWPEKTCSLCGKSFAGPFMLQWHQQSTHGATPTIVDDPDTCEQQKVCQRCGNTLEGSRIEHDWGLTYTVDASTDGHTCNRCGIKRTWSSVDYND